MELARVSKNRCDVSEALALDDLTDMRLSADNVIEARAKEIQYVRDMGVEQMTTPQGTSERLEGYYNHMGRHKQGR